LVARVDMRHIIQISVARQLWRKAYALQKSKKVHYRKGIS
jgi:hypothetical protein